MNVPLRSLLRDGCLALIIAVLLSFGAHAPADAADEGVVRGLIWEDIDGDGRVDPGEPPISFDRPIYLESASGLIRAQSIPTAAGRYAFPPVGPGQYHINLGGEVAGLTWVAVHPQLQLERGIQIAVEVGATSTELDIGLVRVSSLARFNGRATIGSVEVEHPTVEAFVNGKLCSFRSGLVPAFGGSARVYTIAVASNAVIPGCAGELGAPITFRVNGILANESATWQPAESFLLLTAGGPATPFPARVGSGTRHDADSASMVGGAGALALLFVLTARTLTGRLRR